MRNPIIKIACIFLAASALGANAATPAIIPQPQKLESREGTFKISPETTIVTDFASFQTAQQLARRIRSSTGYALEVHRKMFANKALPNGILLTTRKADSHLGPEGYGLTITPDSVVIRAPAQAGLFYGVQTLLQLLPPDIFSTNEVTGVDWQMPCVEIEDWPQFKWRGLMLDVSRHFYTKTDVERILDLMSMYKMNRFHWHLTDDNGWRIQIKKYPKLTEVGAWRDHSRLMQPGRWSANSHPAWVEPAADKFGPDERYGGFYTQKDIREVVAFAAARHITIIPEIEMPGHSTAALDSYPELRCLTTNGTRVSRGGVYCAGNDQTYVFLENVLKEVFGLFPGKYIHIGGDEVDPGRWKYCEFDQARMKAEGMTNVMQLQSYFIKRIETFANARGKTLVGWSEILQGGLAPNAVVMDWIGGGKEAAKQGHDVVMTPTDHCYFDHYQSTNHTTEPPAMGDYLPLSTVYSFNPVPAGLEPEYASHILGGQANLWTEFVSSLPHVEYMVFPRLCALSEAVWSPKDAHDWPDFQRRMKWNEQELDKLGVNYRAGLEE